MSEWWEVPYKGGPMAVPAAMFPRPLYPPDASSAGKTPSSNGPDCEAYKRVLWRLGRWQGPASSFDRAWSNAVAHGKGPNVVDSGAAGFQRQMRIEPDSGWIGPTTYNALMSARVPKGPHAGEMGCDANAANLIAQAFELYGGKAEPPPAPGPTTRARALAAAVADLGYRESPAGSNRTKYGAWYGMDGQPWCAMAVSHWFEVDAGGSPTFAKGARFSYCPYVVEDARNGRNGLSVVGSGGPIPGDLVLFDWDGGSSSSGFDHIGLFEKWTSGRAFQSIEGNTSTSDNSNGGEVMRRQRDAAAGYTVEFVRVAEP